MAYSFEWDPKKAASKLTDPDMARLFPDSRAVNEALRTLTEVRLARGTSRPKARHKRTAQQRPGADGVQQSAACRRIEPPRLRPKTLGVR